MVSPSEKKRKKEYQRGLKCPKVKGLREVCRYLNKDAGYAKYNVDHIMELSKGGKDAIENLWIVPAEWNQGCIDKSSDMLLYIHRWIKKNGRVCLIIPDELLLLEQQHMLNVCKSIGLIK